MAITFITGKPGAGKGLVAVQEVVNELVLGHRPIITNLALRVEPWVTGDFRPRIGLRNFLLREYKKDFDVRRRVFVVPDEDVKEFFLTRRRPLVDGQPGALVKAQPVLNIKGGESKVVAFETAVATESGGHVYIVDEAWHFWGSRSWQTTGEGLLFYNAQHRKFGDDLFVVTQATKQIDPAVHRLAQEFWLVKNHSKMSFGWFRRPSVFTIEIFENPPTGSRQAPMSTKSFTLDREGLAQCYDTSAGVGLSGRSIADIGARKRGLPFWAMPVGVCALALCAWYLLRGAAWGVGHELGKAPGQMSHAARAAGAGGPAVSAAPVPTPATVAVAKPVVTVVTNYVVEPRPEPIRSAVMITNELFCKGYFMFGKNEGVVFLSDGSTLDIDSGRIQRIAKTFVIVDGVKLPIRKASVICPAAPALRSQRSEESDLVPAPIQQAEPPPPFGGIVVTPPVGGVH